MSTSTLPQPATTTANNNSTASLQLIPLAAIVASKTNPRKSFDGPAFDELVASVREHGVLQPILVRPFPHAHSKACFEDPGPAHGSPQVICEGVSDRFELVAGERRFKAAKAAGLLAIQASVRELTNEQALEIQIIENLQRKDVSAVEEAGGYRQLVETLAKVNPKASRTVLVQTIAERIGKSVRYVWARMKLNELVPELQEDLRLGRIDASHADELVRLCEKDQKNIRAGVDELYYFNATEGGEGSHGSFVAHSVKHLKHLITTKYQDELAKAPWKLDDAKLLPKAGACTTCLKNSSLAPNGDGNVKAPKCMDRSCYSQKRAAFITIDAVSKTLDAAADGKAPKTTEIVHVTTQHRLSGSRSNDKAGPILRKDWKTVKPGECPHARPAVVVEVGEVHDQAVAAKFVCTNKKCEVHFGAKPEPRSTSSGAPKVDPKQAELERKKAAEKKRENQVRVAMLKKFASGITEMSPLLFQMLSEVLTNEVREAGAMNLALGHNVSITKVLTVGSFKDMQSAQFAKAFALSQAGGWAEVPAGSYYEADWCRDNFERSLKDLGFDAKKARVEVERELDAAQPKKTALTPEQLASIADPKAPKKSKAPSSKKAAASPKAKTTKKAAKRAVAKKSSTKKGGR